MHSDGEAKTDERIHPASRSIFSSQTFSHRQTASPSSAMSESGFGLVGCSRRSPLPTVLPCWRAGQIVDWYGLAYDERQFRELGEGLTAFIGPTYTTFRGQRARLDLNDEIDLAVQTLTGGLCYKFRGDESAGSAKAIWQALERLRAVFSRRGQRNISGPEAIGRVLRHFFMALPSG